MKKILLFIFITIFISATSIGGHIYGGYLSYTHISGNQYKLTLKILVDCSGPPAPPAVFICASALSQNPVLTVNYTLTYVSHVEIFQAHCIPSVNTTCVGGTVPGVRERTYENTVTLPVADSLWRFSYTECCRNMMISTLQLTGSESWYIFTTLNNISFQNNSSAPLISFPSYYCQYATIAMGLNVVDPDGDSLVYSWKAASTAPSSCFTAVVIPYMFGYSPSNPISSAPSANLSSNGALSFTPNLIQAGVFCFSVEEYRNGIKIAETRTDNLFIIEPNTTGHEENASSPFEVHMPDESHIEIIFSEPQHAVQISLTDPAGRKIISSEIKNGEDRLVLEIPETAAGVYLLNVYAKEKTYSRKIVLNNQN